MTKSFSLYKKVSLRTAHHQLNSVPSPLSPLNKMFIRFASLLPIAALVAVVAGAPNALEARNGGSSECNTGTLQCCNSVSTVSFSRSSRCRA